MRAPTPGIDAVDGALFDADHDGDLDLWLVNGRGANELLNNNGDGTFRRIARAGRTGRRIGRPSRGVAVADLDGDRDHDLVVLKASPPHEVFLNDRVWQYAPGPGFERFAAAALDAVVAADSDADGQVELYTSGPRGLERWQPDDRRRLEPRGHRARPMPGAPRASWPLPTSTATAGSTCWPARAGWAAWSTVARRARRPPIFDQPPSGVTAWAVVARRIPSRGPSVFGAGIVGLARMGARAAASAVPRHRAHGPRGRQRSTAVEHLGHWHATGGAGRITLDGGRHRAHRRRARARACSPFDRAGRQRGTRADFVSLVWSDGILQTEIDLDGGRLHRIAETQRQLSSCPVLFAFDGTGFRFVTDILGVGGIGFLERPGVYSPPHPHERVLLPDGMLAARDGRYALMIGEPMEEVAYLDRAALTVYDLPPGWQMALDERKAIAGPVPTGAPIFYREERRPARVTNDRGDDVTARTADCRSRPPPRRAPSTRASSAARPRTPSRWSSTRRSTRARARRS